MITEICGRTNFNYKSIEVSGDKIQTIQMIPRWVHNIINQSDTENLVAAMWANEAFDPEHLDTFEEPV